VGTEPQDEVACSLRALPRDDGVRPGMRTAAAAIMLERVAGATAGAPTVGPIAVAPGRAPFRPPPGSVCLAPRDAVEGGADVLDLEQQLGDTYGALGVLQVAAAAELLQTSRPSAAASLLCGDPRDGWRTATLSAPAVQEAGR
jgi:3-oxoacyl-[acyl-carrier-protein] synthase II